MSKRDQIENLEIFQILVAHCEEIPVPIFGELPEISDKDAFRVEGHEDEEEVVIGDDAPHPFSQKELNDLVRDLSLSKDSAELLASRLKEKNSSLTVLASASSATGIKSTSIFFSTVKNLVYCADIAQVLLKLGVPRYEPKDWRLFINSSKRSLKCVLLHNGKQFASVPIAHSTTLKEKYEAVKYVLEKIGYDQHKWFICVDLKMVNFLLGQQSSFTQYPCFLCMWDSRDCAQHYMKKDWRLREELVPCKERNVINDPLVDRDRILFPLLHIKLGLIKQFIKALDKDGDCFTYLCQAFPGLAVEKLKAGIFGSPQIRQLIRDPKFENSMNEVELEVWKAFVLVVKNFLGNNKARNYAEFVNNILTAFRNLGCNMSVKMHYLFSPVSWEPGFNEWRAGEEIPSGPERDGEQVSGLLGHSHDGWLLLESERRRLCRWAFQEFKETEVQALKFEQWWSNMQFTCTYLYQWSPFSLQ